MRRFLSGFSLGFLVGRKSAERGRPNELHLTLPAQLFLLALVGTVAAFAIWLYVTTG